MVVVETIVAVAGTTMVEDIIIWLLTMETKVNVMINRRLDNDDGGRRGYNEDYYGDGKVILIEG